MSTYTLNKYKKTKNNNDSKSSSKKKEYKKFKTPGGGWESRPGPHKVDLFEKDLRPLMKGWTTTSFQNKVKKFAKDFDKKNKKK